MTVDLPPGEAVDPTMISVLPAADIGLTGVVVIIVLMILAGLLVPRWTLNRIVAARDERIGELKDVLEKERARNCLQSQQITALLESGRTSAHVLESLRDQAAAEHPPREGSP